MQKVIELNLNDPKDRSAFVAFPFRLAEDHAPWRPGLQTWLNDRIDPRSNPFMAQQKPRLFQVISEDGQIHAQAGFVGPGYFPDQTDRAMLIFPDMLPNYPAFQMLMEHIETEAELMGAISLIGPFNPNIHYDVGIQFSGFEEENAVFMGYQPQYYQEFFEGYGFNQCEDFYSWRLDKSRFTDTLLASAERRVLENPHLKFRHVQLKHFSRELHLFHGLYCESFADHWGFVAPDFEEFKFIAGDLKYLLKAPMAIIAEYKSKPVGFVLGIPDPLDAISKRFGGKLSPMSVLNLAWRWRSIQNTRVMIAGVLPAFRQSGIHIHLFLQIARNIFSLGYEGGQIAWVMDRNRAVHRMLASLGAERRQGYRIYEKDIPPRREG